MAKEKHLVLGSGEFYVRNDRFPYTDVVGTEFYHVRTQKKQNFVNAGVDHNIDIKIYLASRSAPLQIRSGPQFVTLMWADFGEESAEQLITKFHELSVQTFQRRLEKYTKSLQDHGYFWYDGKRFFGTGEVIADKWVANLKTDQPWYRVPFQIFLEVRPSGFMRRAVRRAIDTKRDTDVFFAILKAVYGKEWG